MFSRSKELELSLLELHWIDNRTRDNREKLNGGGEGENGERKKREQEMDESMDKADKRKEGGGGRRGNA